MIFNSRVVLRFPTRITVDGSLVSDHRPRWTDISRIIDLHRMPADDDPSRTVVAWNQLFDQNWDDQAVEFSADGIVGYLQSDEFAIPSATRRVDRFDAPLATEACNLQATPWEDDGRYPRGNLHYFRSGFANLNVRVASSWVAGNWAESATTSSVQP